MGGEDPDPPRRTRIKGIAAGAIRFDSAGRILVSPEAQAEAGGFKLPDWLPGGGPRGPGGDDPGGANLSCPVVGCGDNVTACQPLTACVNPECEGVVACPELTACEVMGCADVGCEADVTVCSDIFCRENEACKNDRCKINLGCGDDDLPETETPQL